MVRDQLTSMVVFVCHDQVRCQVIQGSCREYYIVECAFLSPVSIESGMLVIDLSYAVSVSTVL